MPNLSQQPPVPPPFAKGEHVPLASLQCLSCGGPITVHGFALTNEIHCSFCGSVISSAENGSLALLQQAGRSHRDSILPLYARGTLGGIPWEIIGLLWRYCVVDGVRYPWQEFLLFNPYQGYSWLIYSMSDGHWTWGQELDCAVDFSNVRAQVKDTSYRHFQSVHAVVDYVEGEFPWQVRAGDQVLSHEFIAPPESLSIEESQTSEDEGRELNATLLRYIRGEEVWTAFRQKGSPPSTSGIASAQPNPWSASLRKMWISCLLLLGLWFVASIVYIAQVPTREIFQEKNIPFGVLTREIDLGEPGDMKTLEVSFTAEPLANRWAYGELMLIPQGKEEAIALEFDVERWNGVDGGEAWSEGSSRSKTLIGGVEGGKYWLQLTVQEGGDSLSSTGSVPPSQMTLTIRENVVLYRYIVLTGLLILGFPFLMLLFSLWFESRRWQNSDHSSSGD